MEELIYPKESYAIMGACFAVYADKGCGFAEQVYQECLEIELRSRNIPAIPKPKLAIEYKGHTLKQTYEPDFVCYGKIILELKAVTKLASYRTYESIGVFGPGGTREFSRWWSEPRRAQPPVGHESRMPSSRARTQGVSRFIGSQKCAG